jgi:hypothetical protein
MVDIFTPASNFLGLSFEDFEMLFSIIFLLLLLLVIYLYLSLRKRKTYVERSKLMIGKIRRDLEESQKRLVSIKNEKSNVVEEHEVALAKLKEAKELILKQDSEFSEFEGNIKEDISKYSAMEEELKTYRIKLGELNKEKEKKIAEYESHNQVSEKEREKLKSKFEVELEVQKKKLASQQQDFEDEILKRERLQERRIEEIKTQTKDSLGKITMEKDRDIDDLNIEIEKSRKQIEKLKEKIRVLEIEKL